MAARRSTLTLLGAAVLGGILSSLVLEKAAAEPGRAPLSRISVYANERRLGDGAFLFSSEAATQEFETLHLQVELPNAPEHELSWVSRDEAGRFEHQAGPLLFHLVPCRGTPKTSCWRSEPVELTWDPARLRLGGAAPGLLLGLGGTVRLFQGQQELFHARAEDAAFPLLSARVRPVMVGAPGDTRPPMGGDEEGARRIVAQELGRAARFLAPCGVHLGAPAEWEPKWFRSAEGQMMELGCGRSARASGGAVAFRLGRTSIVVPTVRGEELRHIAARISIEAIRHGIHSRRYLNPRTKSQAISSLDMSFFGENGARLVIEPHPELPLSTDEGLPVCVGAVDLTDGLEHFFDDNAGKGTLEERALLSLVDDGDPRTIEWILVGALGSGGRIGESFVKHPGGRFQNMVIVDRNGIRGAERSATLAHELGHVLLYQGGHPDDSGRDDPGRLMDADASEGSYFGPRRVTPAECRRMRRQSSQGAVFPLLGPSGAAARVTPPSPTGRTP